jgi:uncharacterized membrane protein
MDAYVIDWVNLLLRWAHVIVAIAWIGSSFYFVFLDNSLTPPQDELSIDKGVGGELWAIHGGGFYHPQKYLVSPKQIPDHLHWFYWESYSTWLTGFALFSVLYLYQASSFLIDKSLYAWSPGGAIVAALAFLVVFWVVYDVICRAFGRREGGDLIVSIGVTLFVVFASWLACHLFAGRAAFLLVGAMMATSMSANVFFWIIPGQRKVIAQLKAGESVDPVHGQRAKQRSVHNTYFTLPVLIAMLSNHYGFLYGAPQNWLVLVAIMVAGALIRHSFVARHKALVQGKPVPWSYAVAGTLIIAALAVWLMPTPQPKQAAAPPVTYADLRKVLDTRCVLCHNEQVASKNVILLSPEQVAKNAQMMFQQVVALKTMPLNNATQITDSERALIGRWFKEGAPVQ